MYVSPRSFPPEREDGSSRHRVESCGERGQYLISHVRGGTPRKEHHVRPCSPLLPASSNRNPLVCSGGLAWTRRTDGTAGNVTRWNPADPLCVLEHLRASVVLRYVLAERRCRLNASEVNRVSLSPSSGKARLVTAQILKAPDRRIARDRWCAAGCRGYGPTTLFTSAQWGLVLARAASGTPQRPI